MVSMADLKKMGKREKVKVYAGGEVRELTAGYLLRLKQKEEQKKKTKSKSKKGRK